MCGKALGLDPNQQGGAVCAKALGLDPNQQGGASVARRWGSIPIPLGLDPNQQCGKALGQSRWDSIPISKEAPVCGKALGLDPNQQGDAK